jgi:hypothetical protein
VLGTAAIRDPELVREVALAHPRHIVLALDAKDGLVATDGWLAVSTRRAIDVVRDLAELPLAAILYTDILRDGTRTGPNVEATARLAEEGGLPVLASGASRPSTIYDGSRVVPARRAIVGRALREFTLEDAVAVAAVHRGQFSRQIDHRAAIRPLKHLTGRAKLPSTKPARRGPRGCGYQSGLERRPRRILRGRLADSADRDLVWPRTDRVVLWANERQRRKLRHERRISVEAPAIPRRVRV